MGIINNLRFLYHWTKAEEALDNGDEENAKKHKEEMNRLLLLRVKRG